MHAQNKINVVASFSILGDFVKNVGGDRVSVPVEAPLVGEVLVLDEGKAEVQGRYNPLLQKDRGKRWRQGQ